MTQIVVLQPGQRTRTGAQEGAPEAVVKLQALDGQWEIVGKDRMRGIYPEDIELSANSWGSDTCRFKLRRNTAQVWPDLGSFTPCEVDVGGATVWGGRVWETPTQDGDDASISVEGRGWQYHLDDDLFAATYLTTDLTKFKDTRSLLSVDLTRWNQQHTVQAGDGQVVLAAALNQSWPSGTAVGATMDFGPNPDNWMKNVSIFVKRLAGAPGGASLYLRASDLEDPLAAGDDFYSGVLSTLSTAGQTLGGSNLAGRSDWRYLHVFLYCNTTYTPATQDGVVITGLKAGVDSYVSGTQPLVASAVVSDALQRAPKLRPLFRITPTAFQIPDFSFTESRTPRQVWDSVNAFHNYRSMVLPSAEAVFEPFPTTPKYESGAWQGVEFQDASANSGDNIYNKVVVEGVGPDGIAVRVERTQALAASGTDLLNVRNITLVNPSLTNPADGTSGWGGSSSGRSPGGWVIADSRDTTVFDTSPASFKRTVTNSTNLTSFVMGYSGITQTAEGGFDGKTFLITMRIRLAVASSLSGYILSGGMGFQKVAFPNIPANTWTTLTMVVTNKTHAPLATDPNVTIQINVPAYVGAAWADSVTIKEYRGTLVDRRGFTRSISLPVSSALTVPVAQQLGDVFLLNHKTTPLRGQANIAPNGLRVMKSGEGVHPSLLVRDVGELIRFSNRVDPDSGGLGRDGRIASVNYNHNSQTAAVAIDNERRNFEALLGRLGAVTGS